jgi:hypothetical protein
VLTLSHACTIGVFSARVTTDARPVIWKNRDVDNPDQAMRHFDDGRYPYLGLIYAQEPNGVYAGINEAGFAIMNANSANLGSGNPEGIGDGELMKLALQTCAVIADFQRLMDSLNITGRAVPCNLGVMDSTGATAMFEAGGASYVRWDSNTLPEGYIVRANFSLCADTAGQGSYPRYARARQLVSAAVSEQRFSTEYLIEHVARDLGTVRFDPYPLPFEGKIGALPYGFLPASGTISRYKTRSAIFIVGRRADEPVAISTMWTILGEPVAGIALPLWVGARSVPEEMSDRPTARLCDAAQELHDYLYPDDRYPNALNSFHLAELDSEFAPVKQHIYQDAERRLEDWPGSPPDSAELARFEQQIVQTAMPAYTRRWQPRATEEVRTAKSAGLRVRPDSHQNLFDITFRGNPGNRLLSIFNATGRQVARFDLSRTACQQLGECSIRWQPLGLPAGLYFAALDQGSLRETVAFPFVR